MDIKILIIPDTIAIILIIVSILFIYIKYRRVYTPVTPIETG